MRKNFFIKNFFSKCDQISKKLRKKFTYKKNPK